MTRELLTVTSALLLSAGALFGQVLIPEGPDFQVNTATEHSQYGSVVAGNADGSFVVVWSSVVDIGRYLPYDVDARGRRFAADGPPRGGEFQVTVDHEGFEYPSGVASTPDGGFLVVWDDDRAAIRGRLFGPGGAPLSSDLPLTNEPASLSRVTADGAGHFIVVWTALDENNTLGDIRGRRFAADGTPLTDAFQVNTYTPGRQLGATVAAAPDGGFVVVWWSYGSEGDDTDFSSIQARRFAADGTALGSDFQVNTWTTGRQSGAEVAVAADGRFLVVWSSGGRTYDPEAPEGFDGSGFGIAGRVFTADGTPATDELLINGVTSFDQIGPVVAADAAGHFVVAWQSTLSENQYDLDVFGRVLTSDGVPTGVEFQVNSFTPDAQRAPSIFVTPAGDAVVAFNSFDGIGRRDSEIRARRFRLHVPSGADFLWTPEDPVAGETVRFSDVSAGQPSSWSWVFGDGATADARYPEHVFAVPGSYPVTLTVMGDAGTDSITRTVRVSGCRTSLTELCLADRRFLVTVTWRDFHSIRGPGIVVPAGSDDSGLFWFFARSNWEMLVKVLDGCRVNGRYWVFAAATTNVEYTLRVEDRVRGGVREYHNPLGNAAAALTDTAAFATCP